MSEPRITFGIIVLNGEPFISFNLRALYPFAHQIIVVEGACPSAANVASVDGHSRDGTLDAIRRFKLEEDHENKVVIVTADLDGHSNGFWTEKDEMSQAYASRATGNYLWQIDSDEFYKPEDMRSILEMLKKDPSISEVSFRTLTFWGGLKYKVDGTLLRLGDQDFHRLFSWKPGYRYLTHRPPTVVDEQGNNIMDLKSISAKNLAQNNIFLYHYEYLFPIQVHNKAEYYENAPHCQGLRPDSSWVDTCYMNLNKPFRVHNIYKWRSWLESFYGRHPPEVIKMVDDVSEGKFIGISKRHTSDIDVLLNSKPYLLGIILLKISMPFVKGFFKLKFKFRDIAIKLRIWSFIKLIMQTIKRL
jgi:hypothetical protein